MKIFIFLFIFVLKFPAAQAAGESKTEFTIFDLSYPRATGLQSNVVGFDAHSLQTWNWSSSLELNFEFDADFQNVTEPKDRARFDFSETQFRWKIRGWKIQVGMIRPQWTSTDGLNPMNLLNAIDATDLLRTKDLGQLGASVFWAGSPITLEWIVVPWARLSRLPGASSSWWPQGSELLILSENQSEFRVPQNINYQIFDAEAVGKAQSWNSAAQVKAQTASFDFAVAYHDGVDPTPNIQTNLQANLVQVSPVVFELASPVQLTPIFYRRQAQAFSVQWTGDSSSLKASHRRAQSVRSQVYSVLGIEQHFGSGLSTWVLVLEKAFSQSGISPTDSLAILNQASFFERAWFFGIRKSITESSLLGVDAVYDSEQKNQIYRAQITHRWSENLSTNLLSTWLEGPKTSITGIATNKDRIDLLMTAVF